MVNSFSNFYYDGDCNDPNVQATITDNFLGLMTNVSYIPPFFCLWKPLECNADTVEVYCGAVSAPDRRRKRRSIREVWGWSIFVDSAFRGFGRLNKKSYNSLFSILMELSLTFWSTFYATKILNSNAISSSYFLNFTFIQFNCALFMTLIIAKVKHAK